MLAHYTHTTRLMASMLHSPILMATRMGFGLIGTMSCMALGFSLWACGSDKTSEFDQAQKGTSFGTDPTGSLGGPRGTGTSSSSTSGSSAVCSARAPANIPGLATPSKVNVCSDAEVEGYWDACFNANYDDAKCKAYTAAHASCTSCLATPDTAATAGPIVLHKNSSYYTLNVAGCIALAQKKSGTDSCAAAYAKALNCKDAACDSCFTGSQSDYSNYNDCKKNNNVQQCEQLASGAGATCGDLKMDPAAACFGTIQETNFQIYKRMAQLFCRDGAASASDAGAAAH